MPVGNSGRGFISLIRLVQNNDTEDGFRGTISTPASKLTESGLLEQRERPIFLDTFQKNYYRQSRQPQVHIHESRKDNEDCQ